MASVEHISPSAAELDKVITKLNCPHCTSVFNTGSNLNLHLAKTHNLPHLLQSQSLQNVTKLYHCPVATCSYNESKHFKKYKFVKQHYLKMHSEKKFICEKCKTGFSTEASKRNHVEYCDISFKCCDCSAFYNSYETLKTHGRRKKHRILDKIKYKIGIQSTFDASLPSSAMKWLLLKNPKSLGVILVPNTSNESSQTDLVLVDNNDVQTQTMSVCNSPQLTVATQTIGDCLGKAKKDETFDFKHMNTQTILSEPKSVSCNTICTAIRNDTDEDIKCSSSSQTMINDCDLSCSTPTRTFDSIHTDTSDLLTETLDSNYFNCDMETQTDFLFNGDLLKDCDYYSHMYTQTCKDLLLGEIGLNDTQTGFDDVLKSIGSQTVMSHADPTLSSKDDKYGNPN